MLVTFARPGLVLAFCFYLCSRYMPYPLQTLHQMLYLTLMRTPNTPSSAPAAGYPTPEDDGDVPDSYQWRRHRFFFFLSIVTYEWFMSMEGRLNPPTILRDDSIWAFDTGMRCFTLKPYHWRPALEFSKSPNGNTKELQHRVREWPASSQNISFIWYNSPKYHKMRLKLFWHEGVRLTYKQSLGGV